MEFPSCALRRINSQLGAVPVAAECQSGASGIMTERPATVKAQGASPGAVQVRLVRYTLAVTAATSARPGRNQPCHCGSGRKYKHCCLAKDEAQAAAARAKAAAEAAVRSSEAATSAPTRAPKVRTDQPWKATTSRGFIPRTRTPRKVGGS